jgi:hypothetical protein
LNPHLLLFEDTLGSSSSIIWRYLWVLISYYLKIFLGPHLLLTPRPLQNRSPPYNGSPSGIEAQCEGYNFSDILEAHPVENEHKIDNFKN